MLTWGSRLAKRGPQYKVSTRTEEDIAMAIVVVSRWKGCYEQALPIVCEAT